MKRTLWLKALQVFGDIDRTLGISPSPKEEQKNSLPACTCSLLLGAASSPIPCCPVVWVGATNHGIHPYSYTSDHMTQVQPIRNFPWEFSFGTNREKPILWRQHHKLSSSKLLWGWWTFPTLWERTIWVAGGRANPSREAEVRNGVVELLEGTEILAVVIPVLQVHPSTYHGLDMSPKVLFFSSGYLKLGFQNSKVL